jgi:hypothetical protein
MSLEKHARFANQTTIEMFTWKLNGLGSCTVQTSIAKKYLFPPPLAFSQIQKLVSQLAISIPPQKKMSWKLLTINGQSVCGLISDWRALSKSHPNRGFPQTAAKIREPHVL